MLCCVCVCVVVFFLDLTSLSEASYDNEIFIRNEDDKKHLIFPGIFHKFFIDCDEDDDDLFKATENFIFSV